MGSSITSRETTAETAKFALNDGVRVFADDGGQVQPGSKEIGLVGTSGMVPLGYYKDPDKVGGYLSGDRRRALQLPRGLCHG